MDNRKQFIYKEPKVTSLGEISSRLEKMYASKFGKDKIKLILESAKVGLTSAWYYVRKGEIM